jgi:hypothetical protein
MERMGHASPQVALRYQHVMARRDQAIAAVLDELVQAAATLAKDQPPAASGTRGASEADLRGAQVAASALTWGVGGGDDGTRSHDPLLAEPVRASR